MSRYIVRVQLHETELTHPNYRKLHDLMHEARFVEITPMPGGFFKLPHAEYAKICDEGTEQVLAEAVAVASKIQKDPAVVVSKTTEVRSSGLEKIPNEKVQAAMKAAAK